MVTDYTCDCELVCYENDDGICSHPACEGIHHDCGDIIEGTPTSPEQCVNRQYFEVTE